jgi:predicted aspartyl protease
MIALLLAASLLTPQQVLAQSRVAFGSFAPGAYKVEEQQHIADGSTVAFERMWQGRDYVVTRHDGAFTSAYGSAEGTAWIQNANGIVTTRRGRSGFEDPYATAVAEPETSSTMHMIDAPAGEVAIEIDPRPGSTERLYYDATTYLLQRNEFDDADGKRAFTYSAYKKFFGRMVATHVAFTGAEAQDTWTSDVVSYDQIPASDARFAVPASRVVFDAGSQAVAVPADFTESGIIVRITIDGRGLDFILDSGASGIVIDDRDAHELGLNVTEQHSLYAFGHTTVGQAMVDDFAVGALHAHNVAVSVTPLEMPGGIGRKIVGLLGADFFASGRVTIDFGKKTVTLSSPDAPLAIDGWSRVPIEVTSLVPLAPVTFSGTAGKFIVDTGAFRTILYQHYFDKFPKPPGQDSNVAGNMMGVAGNPHAFKNYTFSTMEIGDLAFSGVDVSVIQGGSSIESNTFDGLLGRTFLENFAVIFDYADHALYLKSEL